MQLKIFLDPLWIDLKERKLTNNASKRSTVQVKDFYASSIKNWILPWEYFFPHVSIRKERKNKKKDIKSSLDRKLLTENHLSIIFTMIFVCCWYSHQKCMSTTRFLLELPFKILDIQTQVKRWHLIWYYCWYLNYTFLKVK